MQTSLSFFRIFKILRRHRSIAERRDPIYEANKAAKWVIGFSAGMMALYLLGLSILLALSANESSRFTSPEFIMGVSPFIFFIDFWARFVAQQTPSQIIKPYILLPLPRYACIDSFVITSLFTWGNLIWFALLIPYCLMSVVFSYGLLSALSLLLLFYMMILTNSQWYAIVRTLISRSQLWWALPVVFYLAVAGPWVIVDFKYFMTLFATIGTDIEYGNLLPHAIALLLLTAVTGANRRLQYNNVMQELGKQADTAPKKVYSFSMLDRLGELGEYLKLETYLVMRNKNPRKTFIFATALVFLISLIISFTEVYDTDFMTNFWCIYNFVIYAAMILAKVMNYEGNYIDALMVHKENILKLLTAKYYFFCMLLILPFILMLPMVFVGKWHILMLVSYAVFTAGFQHFLLMQLAVYNNKAIPLNEKFIGKGGIENNYIQVVEEMIAFFLPLLVIHILSLFLVDYTVWFIMMAVGFAFVATHRLWLRNIYNRLMARRYKNLESFHA